MGNDWRVKKTFILIKKELGGIKKIDKLVLRKYYIKATDNYSYPSFLDFLQRCQMDGFLKPNRPYKPTLFHILNLKKAVSDDNE